MKILIPIFAAWAAAWAIVIGWAPELAVVAALGFLQNVAFTFVSRGRNSGSLSYHMAASIFSNGIWLVMFVYNVNIVAGASGFPMAFAAVYILSTMSGSVFAHWLAKRVERGAARNVQEDRVKVLEKELDILSARVQTVEGSQKSAWKAVDRIDEYIKPEPRSEVVVTNIYSPEEFWSSPEAEQAILNIIQRGRKPLP